MLAYVPRVLDYTIDLTLSLDWTNTHYVLDDPDIL